jgi:hypothetical protein
MAVSLSALRAGLPLPPGRFLVLISVRGWVDPGAIVRLEGLGKLKKKKPSSGLHPATCRLVAWCLNQLRYRVPPYRLIAVINSLLSRSVSFYWPTRQVTERPNLYIPCIDASFNLSLSLALSVQVSLHISLCGPDEAEGWGLFARQHFLHFPKL